MARRRIAMRGGRGRGLALITMIPAPYLLYLGHSTDPLAIKTSRGVAMFRGEDCVGEFRHDDCPLTLDLPRLGMEQAVAAGAKTMVLGIASPGGALGAELVADAAAALNAGMNVASGLHQRLRECFPTACVATRRRGQQLAHQGRADQDFRTTRGQA